MIDKRRMQRVPFAGLLNRVKFELFIFSSTLIQNSELHTKREKKQTEPPGLTKDKKQSFVSTPNQRFDRIPRGQFYGY